MKWKNSTHSVLYKFHVIVSAILMICFLCSCLKEDEGDTEGSALSSPNGHLFQFYKDGEFVFSAEVSSGGNVSIKLPEGFTTTGNVVFNYKKVGPATAECEISYTYGLHSSANAFSWKITMIFDPNGSYFYGDDLIDNQQIEGKFVVDKYIASSDLDEFITTIPNQITVDYKGNSVWGGAGISIPLFDLKVEVVGGPVGWLDIKYDEYEGYKSGFGLFFYENPYDYERKARLKIDFGYKRNPIYMDITLEARPEIQEVENFPETNPYLPERHKGWAGSNIYYDAVKQHMTFDDINAPMDSQMKNGLYFKWGSLYGVELSPVHWAPVMVYAPGGGGEQKWLYEIWNDIPYVTDIVKSDHKSAYLYKNHNPSAGTGDICRYLTEKGFAPSGKKWRMPTASEVIIYPSFVQQYEGIYEIVPDMRVSQSYSGGTFRVPVGVKLMQTGNPFFPNTGNTDSGIHHASWRYESLANEYDSEPGNVYWNVDYGRYWTSTIGAQPGYVGLTEPLAFTMEFERIYPNGARHYYRSWGFPVRCVIE